MPRGWTRSVGQILYETIYTHLKPDVLKLPPKDSPEDDEMAQWYSKELGDGVAAFEPTIALMQRMGVLLMMPNTSKEAAMFSRSDISRNMVTVYFSPDAKSIAEDAGAIPCDKPTSERLGLIAGHIDAWKLIDS